MATQTRKKRADDMSPPKTLDKFPFYGYELDDEQLLFANTVWDKNIDIVFCNAAAGTGKTTVATGVANMLVKYGLYQGIIYIMSPYGERKQGWLPGTITEKSSVYFEAFYQALVNCDINPVTSINDDSMVNQKNGSGYITCITDTFLRGSTLDNAVVIIDEAQNYTISQLKKTLTRVGSNSKVIVIGHELQCDLDVPSQSGFMKYLKHFEGQERAAICSLTTNHRSWISQHADQLEE